jgi:hypothetical protein
VKPHRRGKQILDKAGDADHTERQDENTEHRRPVAGVVAAEAETASRAAIGDAQKTFEQTTPAAPRAAASQPEAEAAQRVAFGFGGYVQRSGLPQ